jgi:hypothetical protein
MLFRASLMSPIFVDTDVDTTCIASLSYEADYGRRTAWCRWRLRRLGLPSPTPSSTACMGFPLLWWRLRHTDMRLVPVPVRRMRLVLLHASCCAIELSELERRGGGGPILSLDGVGAFVLSLQRCLAPTGQDAQSLRRSRSWGREPKALPPTCPWLCLGNRTS